MATPNTYFSILLEATAASISIVLVFVITIYTARQSIRQNINIRFEEESRQLSEKYFKNFEEINRKMSLMESDSINILLGVNMAVETDHMTAEKVMKWAEKQENKDVAAAYGHITHTYFSLEAFDASPYTDYKKRVFDNMGDHLINLRSILVREEVKENIIDNSDISNDEYMEFLSDVEIMIDEWISIHAKNYTINITNKESIIPILDICKWLFVVGVIIPLLFLLYIPPSLYNYITKFSYIYLSDIGFFIINHSNELMFFAQIMITATIVWLAWKLLKYLLIFFEEFNIPEQPMSIEEKQEETQDIPKIPNKMFE